MAWHELRHFAATWYLELGLTPADVALQLGHRDGGKLVMEVYAHPSERKARDRIAAAAAGAEGIIDRSPNRSHDLQTPNDRRQARG